MKNLETCGLESLSNSELVEINGGRINIAKIIIDFIQDILDLITN